MNQLNSESSHTEKISPLVTLDEVSNALSEWRKNKSSEGPNISDKIWLAIFKLAKTYSPSSLRSLFQLSSTQYKKKFEQLCKPAPIPQPAVDDALEESEVSQPTQENKMTLCEVQPLYEPDVLPKSTECMVVEMHKPDGCIMKFHITMSQLRDTLKEFLDKSDASH
ncbi:MAG: hypothetical protein GY821_02585 [Gammaproteobacteria bacterium]|nr:hypothetical protein [Gammaproteobacteria bacterium]